MIEGLARHVGEGGMERRVLGQDEFHRRQSIRQRVLVAILR
jgi:hypothetical protein